MVRQLPRRLLFVTSVQFVEQVGRAGDRESSRKGLNRNSSCSLRFQRVLALVCCVVVNGQCSGRVVGEGLVTCVVSAQESSSGSDCETAKGKLFPDNPFICRTPSATMVDMNGT